MRVHGSIKITRRSNIDKKPYDQYLDELSEDFHHICGYCGKSEVVTTKGFEIDHFVPQTVSTELKDEYQNLVYSCFTCNRKKGSKWPTCNPAIKNNGTVGFVDPASEEYDKHLMRDESGKIIYKTPLGQYLCNIAFKFNNRPTDVIWKAMKIVELKQQLQTKISKLSPYEMKEYIEIDTELSSLMKYIFKKKE